MKKILILTPIYKRPEILKLFLDGYKRIRHMADLLVIRSANDFYYEINMQLLLDYNVRSVEYPNGNLGEKKNYGLNYALKYYKFEYLMDLGSDNLVNPEYLQMMFHRSDSVYENVTGLQHLYIWDYQKNQFYFIKNYAFDHTYGAGRIYPRALLKPDFWPNTNAGMDIGLINKHKFKEDVFYLGNKPLILDIKTKTNINPMDMILSRNENKARLINDPAKVVEIRKAFRI